MRLPRVRFTIGRLMTVVAVAAGLSAWLRVPGAGALTAAAVLILAPASIALLSPFLLARPGRRLLVATWVASLWPLSIPWSLHVAWVITYGSLGHSPGPADNGPIIDVLTGSVVIFMPLSMIASITCLLLPLIATDEPTVHRGHWFIRTIPILMMPVVWFTVMMVMRWDPVRAVWWFMD